MPLLCAGTHEAGTQAPAAWGTGCGARPLSHAQSLLLAWEAMGRGLGRRAGAGLGPPDASWTLRVSHFYSKTQQAVTGVVKRDV